MPAPLAALTLWISAGESRANSDDAVGGGWTAEGLILEFEGVGRAEYDAVNARLGIDAATGQGDWPTGLLYHAGGAKAGGWVVFEVWERATRRSAS